MRHSARLTRSIAALVVAVVAMSGLSVVTPASAVGFSISGHVDLGAVGSSAGAGDVRVMYALQGQQYRYERAVFTDASGNYEFSGIAAGTYSLHFDYRGTGQFSSEFWQDVAISQLANTFPVQANVSGMNVVLAAKAFVSGTVSLGEPGAHPAGGQVRVTWTRFDGYNWSNGPTMGVLSDAAGSYSIQLEIGTYRLHYSATTPGYQGRYWSGASVTSQASPVVVGTSNISGLDLTLPIVGAISGHVNLGDSSTTATAGAVKVSYSVCYDDGCVSSTPPTTYTDAEGNFSFPSRWKGTYTLRFDYVAGTAYQGLFGVVVVVTDSQPIQSGIVVTLPVSGSISGRAYLGSTATPAGAGEVTVSAWYSPPPYYAPIAVSAQTDSSGNYLIVGLQASQYSLQFHYNGGSAFADKHLNNFAVGSSLVSGNDAVLPAGISIAGTLRSISGTAVNKGVVVAYRSNDGFDFSIETPNHASVEDDGSFYFEGLSAGFYWLEYYGDSDGFSRQWLNSEGGSSVVNLAAGDQYDFGEVTVHRLSRIMGGLSCDVCFTESEPPGKYAELWVLTPSNTWEQSRYLNFNFPFNYGSYDFTGLFPGTYKIRAGFEPDGAGYETYESAPFVVEEHQFMLRTDLVLRRASSVLPLGALVRQNGTGPLYYVSGSDTLVPVSEAALATDLGIPGTVRSGTTSTFSAYSITPAPLTNVVVCDGTSYFASGGKLWPVPTESVAGLPQTPLNSPVCSMLPKSALTVLGSLFVQSTTGGAVFQIMADGSKRQVTGRVSLIPGKSGLFVLKVASSFLNSRPSGPPIQPLMVPPPPAIAYAPPALASGAPIETRTECFTAYLHSVGISIFAPAAPGSDAAAALGACLAA